MNLKLIRSSSSAAVVVGFVTLAAAWILPRDVAATRDRPAAAEINLPERQFLEEEAREVRRQALAPDEREWERKDGGRASIPLLWIGGVLLVLGGAGRMWSGRREDPSRTA